MAYDPEEEEVRFLISWGDGKKEWTSFTSSGQNITLRHTWTNKGEFTIRTYAEDSNGIESPESTFTIKIPRNKIKYNSYIQNILKRFPLIKQIILLS